MELISTNDLGFIFSKTQKVIRKTLAKLNIKPLKISKRGSCKSFRFKKQEAIEKLRTFFCHQDSLAFSTGKNIPFKIGSVVKVTNVAGNTFIGRLSDKQEYLSHATLKNGWRVAIGHDALVELMSPDTPLTSSVWFPTTTEMASIAFDKAEDKINIFDYKPGKKPKEE